MIVVMINPDGGAYDVMDDDDNYDGGGRQVPNGSSPRGPRIGPSIRTSMSSSRQPHTLPWSSTCVLGVRGYLATWR